MKPMANLLATLGLIASLITFASPLQSGQIIVQPNPQDSKDIWTTSVYSYAPGGGGPGGGLNNEWLRVGGWGDEYYSLIYFDLFGMPKVAQSAKIELYFPRISGFGTTKMYLDRITEFWDWKTQGTGSDRERLWWMDLPVATAWRSSPLPEPTAGQWYSIDITDLYNAWQNGTYPNYGVQLRPVSNNNQWCEFYSSDYLDNPSLRPKLVISSSDIVSNFLSFPLDCSTPDCMGGILYRQGAYTPKSVVSVLDHSMKKNNNGQYPYGTNANNGLDGIVLAWTGEKGQGTPKYQGCYPQVYPQVGGIFKIGGTYVSDTLCSNKKLNYDDHPGYDYKATFGTPVKAAAPGKVVSINGERCFKNNFSNCEKLGAVGIDHRNGYISQYLHMSEIIVDKGDEISKDQPIGYSGYKGLGEKPTDIGKSHLHFEVLKKVGSKYVTVDPYGWSGTCRSDPMFSWTGVCNYRLWK